MRNLKKLFAVVMVVAMLASMMVPALAAGVEYEDEATILQDLGLFQGYGAGELGLADDLTREQGLALMLRVMGLEDEVKAMTEEEVAAELARVVDPETVTATWAKPYVAYAVKNGLTKGIDASILPNVKFAGQLKMTGKEFINLMLNGMGYATAWDDVLTKAAEVEMLSAGESVTFGTVKEMTRDDAVAIMTGALTGITSEGITLAQALVDAGAVDADKMEEYGFIVPEVVPTEAPVEITAEATTDNLIQIYVEFNTEVDKDSAEDEGNYDIDDVEVKAAALQDDGVTVVLTLEKAMEQQDKVDLVISGVKDADGEVIDEFTIEDIEFLDMTIPTAIDALVVGNDTFKVIFSEPMNDESAEKGDFVVNGGKLYVKDITFQKNNTEALVTMYSLFKEGEVTLQVKSGTEDYAGFGVIGKLFTLEVVEDEEAPVVIGYEKAKRGEVTLIWSEDIEENGTITLGDEPDVYHTNAKNPASGVEIDGNKMKLTFENEDDWLPAGTAYVYVMKDTVRDLWNNKNAQQMTEIEVEVDEEPPVVDGSIKVVSETKIEIKFDEALKKKSAEEEDNYTILDDKGEEVENIIDDITYSSKKVTITFYEDLKGDHSIVIKDVEDIYGNKMPKTVVDFFVGDVTPPALKDFKAVLYKDKDGKDQMVKVSFGEAMATEGKYAVNDIEKYEINGIALVNIKDVEIKVVDDGKAVEIHIPSSADFEKPEEKNKDSDNLDFHDVDAGVKEIEIARVADAAGNYIAPLSYKFDIDPSDEIKVDGNVEATAKKTLKIKFDDNVAKFDIDDILVSKAADEATAKEQANVKDSVYRMDIAEVDTALDKGKTVVTITLAKDMDPDLATPVYVYIIGDKSTNVYEKTLEKGKYDVIDKIAPEVIKDGIKFADKDADANNIITIEYNEALKDDADLVALYAQDLIVKNRDNKTLVANVDYKTELSKDSDNVLIVSIEKDKDEEGFNLEKYSVECKDTVNYIQDAEGNKAKSFDRARN